MEVSGPVASCSGEVPGSYLIEDWEGPRIISGRQGLTKQHRFFNESKYISDRQLDGL
jgi:hypothetical protein